MEKGYYHAPTIYQNTVVFGCEDDLWTVPAKGGVARRLTANLGHSAHPALSPDGTLLAFTGRDEGESEVYVMPAVGGQTKRLTYLGVDSKVVGWTPSGEVVFSSNTAQAFSQLTNLYAVNPVDGQSVVLSVGSAVSASFGPDGGVVIARHVTDIARWKRYRGGLTGDLWIDKVGDANWQRLIQLDGNVAQPLWLNKRIYFVSDHEGVGNLYSCSVEGDDLHRHTDHDDYYVRHPATDGQQIVYQTGADLHIFNPQTEQSQLIKVEFYSPRVQRQRKFVYASPYLEGYDIHPQGHSVVITARGKTFSFYNWEDSIKQHGELNGVRYRLATWLNNGTQLALISDATGEERLEIHCQSAQTEPETLADLDIGRPRGMKASPTKNQLALSNHRHELMLIDLDDKTRTVLDHSPYNNIQGFAWSPDGRWLAYGFSESSQTSCIKLCELETGQTHVITNPVLRDINPSFDPDGKYLYFISYRTFNPIYDSMQFELGFPWGTKPYLITLQADLPSPFLPIPRAPGAKPTPLNNNDNDADKDDKGDNQVDQTEQEDQASNAANISQASTNETAASKPAVEDKVPSSEQDDKNKDAENTTDKPSRLKIDLAGITTRVIAFPVAERRYRQIKGISGAVLFTSWPLEGTIGQRWRPWWYPSR